MSQKQCSQCGEWKDLCAYSKAPQVRSGVRAYCKVCACKYRNKERSKVASKKYRDKEDLEVRRARKRAWSRKLRLEVLTALGGHCVNCGQTYEGFLTIDHINNDGAAHRKTVPSNNLYYWLRRNNYPPGFQLLCWNCNCFKGCRGVLPDGKSLVTTAVLPVPEP